MNFYSNSKISAYNLISFYSLLSHNYQRKMSLPNFGANKYNIFYYKMILEKLLNRGKESVTLNREKESVSFKKVSKITKLELYIQRSPMDIREADIIKRESWSYSASLGLSFLHVEMETITPTHHRLLLRST